jgi:hypothetical protein
MAWTRPGTPSPPSSSSQGSTTESQSGLVSLVVLAFLVVVLGFTVHAFVWLLVWSWDLWTKLIS